MLEIYTTGGGDFLYETLNAIAAFFGTSNADAIVSIGLMVGLIILLFQVMFSGDLRMAIKTYVMIALVGTISIGHKSDVIIFDDTKGPLWSLTVDNVPTSVAYIGSASSSVGHALTRQIEAIFSPPTNIAYQRHGMLFGATLMTKSSRWRAVTATIHENLSNFMDQCVLDAVDLRYIDPDVITRSGNLETTIGANMPASLAYYDTITRSTRFCEEGWLDIVPSINNEVQVVLAAQAASTFQGTDGAAAISDLENTISDFASFAGYASATAEDHIKQAMLIAAFDDAANRGISATGNAAALQHLQSARAESQTRSSYQAIGSNALSWVPYLKIVFENLYYGAFPIALALMMTPLCLAVIRGYFGGFVWLASWEPLSAILHSLMMKASAERFQTITSASTSGAYTDSVMSWANHFAVYSIGQDVSVMAGYLMMSIPFVAAAIFFGTQRMVGLATSMLAVSQSAASETGREMATGNLSYGNASIGNRSFGNLSMDNYTRNNASFDNTSGNRTVTSPFTDLGRNSRYDANGNLLQESRTGTVGIEGSATRVNTASGMAVSNSIVGSLRRTSTDAMERGISARNTYEHTHGNMSSRTSSFMQSVQTGEAFSSGKGLSASEEERSSLSESVQTLDKFAENYGVSRQTALEVGLHASAGINFFDKLSVGAKASLQKQGITRESYDTMASASQSSEIGNAVNDLSRASQEYSSSQSGSLGMSADKGSRDSIEDLERQARLAETYERASSSYSEAADHVATHAYDNRDDMAGAFADYLMNDKGMSASQVGVLFNNRGSGDEIRAKHAKLEVLRSEFAEQYIDDNIDPKIGANFSADLPAPSDPGTPIEPGKDVRDAMPTVRRQYSDQWLDTNKTIIRGSDEIPSVGVGGAGVRERADDLKNRNDEVGTWSQGLHDRSGGNILDSDRSSNWSQINQNPKIDGTGFYQADNIIYDLQGKTRNSPPNPDVMNSVSQNAARLGDDIGVVVTSAGQPSFGSRRVGSPRHDHGNAVDFYLTRDGQKVEPAEDPRLYAAMIEMSAKDNSGIGHYDWGLHVGGGNEAFWGPDTTSASADPEFTAAYNRGRNSQ